MKANTYPVLGSTNELVQFRDRHGLLLLSIHRQINVDDKTSSNYMRSETLVGFKNPPFVSILKKRGEYDFTLSRWKLISVLNGGTNAESNIFTTDPVEMATVTRRGTSKVNHPTR